MAEVVATAHNGYKAPYVCTADALRDNILISLGSGELHVDSLLSALYLRHHVGQRHVGIRTHYYISMMLLYELILHTLGHTAQYADNNLAALLLQAVQKLQPADNLLFGIIPDGTGIQEYGISLIHILRQFITRHTHHAGYNLAVSYIHLAAVCFYQ